MRALPKYGAERTAHRRRTPISPAESSGVARTALQREALTRSFTSHAAARMGPPMGRAARPPRRFVGAPRGGRAAREGGAAGR